MIPDNSQIDQLRVTVARLSDDARAMAHHPITRDELAQMLLGAGAAADQLSSALRDLACQVVHLNFVDPVPRPGLQSEELERLATHAANVGGLLRACIRLLPLSDVAIFVADGHSELIDGLEGGLSGLMSCIERVSDLRRASMEVLRRLDEEHQWLAQDRVLAAVVEDRYAEAQRGEIVEAGQAMLEPDSIG